MMEARKMVRWTCLNCKQGVYLLEPEGAGIDWGNANGISLWSTGAKCLNGSGKMDYEMYSGSPHWVLDEDLYNTWDDVCTVDEIRHPGPDIQVRLGAHLSAMRRFQHHYIL